MKPFTAVLSICLYCSVTAAPCPVIWNCPCVELVNGCNTCPCHDNATQSVSTQSTGCDFVDFLTCPQECIVLDNATQCFVCNCTDETAPVCYNCQTSSAPDQCKTVKQCAKHERCHARIISSNGQKEFKFSCMSKAVCDDLSSVSIIGRRADDCNKCCTSDLCNRKLCP